VTRCKHITEHPAVRYCPFTEAGDSALWLGIIQDRRVRNTGKYKEWCPEISVRFRMDEVKIIHKMSTALLTKQ